MSVATGPRIRALQSKSLLVQLERMGCLEEVVERLGDDELVAGIRNAFNMSWLDMYTHDRISIAAEAHLGPERNVEMWQELVLNSFKQPLLEGLLSMMRRMSGMNLQRLARHTDLIYQHIARECGAVYIAPEQAGTRLTICDFPEGYDLGCWARSTLGFAKGVARFADGDPGLIQLVELDDAQRQAVIVVQTAASSQHAGAPAE